MGNISKQWGEVMESIRVFARGKINLTLDVLERRNDGYHNIRSVMQSVGLADQIRLERIPTGIFLYTAMSIDQTQNLAWRAAQAFLTETNINAGVQITLTKHIPIAAGLAGGSADAAGVLWGLNQLFKTHKSLTELQAIGVKLGADIPFCLQGGTMLAEGIGDQLTSLPPLSEYPVVLIKPQESVRTPEVYQNLSETMLGDNHTSSFLHSLHSKQMILSKIGNTLELVTEPQIPAIKRWKTRLLQGGAKASLMSGSGPTVFGIFLDRDLAEEFCFQWEDRDWMISTTLKSTGVCEVND